MSNDRSRLAPDDRIGAAVLGRLADATSISYVCRVCSLLSLLGILMVLLPNVEGARARKA